MTQLLMHKLRMCSNYVSFLKFLDKVLTNYLNKIYVMSVGFEQKLTILKKILYVFSLQRFQ